MSKNAVKNMTQFEIKLTWYQSLLSEAIRAAARSRPKVNNEQRLLDHSALCNLQNVSMNSSTVCALLLAGLLPS
jgi:hypothetical protein